MAVLGKRKGDGVEVGKGERDEAPLWTPPAELLASSNWTKFTQQVNERFKLSLETPQELWKWSVENLEQFWEACWEFTGMVSSQPYSKVIEDKDKMPGAKFFPEARLNFAENLLRFRDDCPAIIFKAETSNQEEVMSFKELYERVAKLSARLAEMGVVAGDRVAAYIPNIPEAIVAMLATTSLGAIWSSCSPDFGAQGVLDRFAQITPKVVFTTDGYFYKGQRIDIEGGGSKHDLDLSKIRGAVYHDRFIEEAVQSVKDTIPFARLPFDHPVYVMYSSGTTGLPKCLVQGPGVVLNHLKELANHLNVQRQDRVFYYTTTGWMMWNWVVSTLGVGATLVLFDGNPLYPSPEALWKFGQDVGVTVFGTSACYLAAVMDSGCVPGKTFDLSKLRLITSTGSPASTNIFKFVYEGIKSDVQFASISGGTDLNGCFALGCTNLPVRDSELQTRGLGLDVRIFDDDGKEIHEEQGELVCKQPFPSMPLYFWNDESGSKYHGACIWKHGDFAKVTNSGGVIVCGRSDATLKPGGVRIGAADIYKVLGRMEEVADSVVVGQNYTLKDGTPDVRILLFVVMATGYECTPAFQKKVRQCIRDQASPRHMPGMVVACPAIPHTVSGKKVELTVKKIIDGQTVTNKNALQNPESLAWFEEFATSLRNKETNGA
ncbi:hypothetical protein PHYSODRAFT_297189 [Phytophthora sojae]|uniref:AMP-dependent synthetase/ligase domain-containing protein n=1 Tax=Phytophthora sojae (strain P6497) TaxID=1094619 RepID=G4YWD3_PHYSP|nr:hypothetical protein PHYSODRAFT_297189 [Phytophthora sojae]EGZ26489.1 hypothetical protein PHYSODRAFT_297189 [Phytophthora sojae]|eukprot:XP_009521777.1 hypothetical protein PHYSODRAFT_297189 [Phytophthora sojae]